MLRVSTVSTVRVKVAAEISWSSRGEVGGWVVVRGGVAHLGVCLLLVGRAQLAPIALDLALGHGGHAARLAPEEHGPGAASEEQAAAAALEAAEPSAHRPPPQ